jgi:hypothetical protein
MVKKIKYNTEKYNFSNLVSGLFEVEDLSDLHLLDSDLVNAEPLTQENEAETLFHKKYYEKLNGDWPELITTFKNFVEQEVSKIFKGPFLYQTTPSFRVQVPNQTAVSKWHYDSDPNHGHPDWEINIQIALTKVFGNNSTWIESVPGLGDYSPMELEYGECAIFDGNRCVHGNYPNDTGKTRVSYDFRVIPCNMYDGFGEPIFALYRGVDSELFSSTKYGFVGKFNSPTSYYGKEWGPGGYYTLFENKG